MSASPAHAQALAENLRAVVSRINAVATPTRPVRLVAVSKLKPATDILSLYTTTAHTHFGENYVQELLDKAATLPREINWHFIGQLQTNKARKLAETIPNLWAIESCDTLKKASHLEAGRANLTSTAPSTPPLRVYVQVNTSGEASKSGCEPADALGIAKLIHTECPHLTLQGLMTIGNIMRSRAADVENEDFLLLKETVEAMELELGGDLELSMGMSSDYEAAIQLGAANVRVGTAIFGDRPPKP